MKWIDTGSFSNYFLWITLIPKLSKFNKILRNRIDLKKNLKGSGKDSVAQAFLNEILIPELFQASRPPARRLQRMVPISQIVFNIMSRPNMRAPFPVSSTLCICKHRGFTGLPRVPTVCLPSLASCSRVFTQLGELLPNV